MVSVVLRVAAPTVEPARPRQPAGDGGGHDVNYRVGDLMPRRAMGDRAHRSARLNNEALRHPARPR